MENKTAEGLLAKEMGWEVYASGGIMTDTEPIIKVMKEYTSLHCADKQREIDRLTEVLKSIADISNDRINISSVSESSRSKLDRIYTISSKALNPSPVK